MQDKDIQQSVKTTMDTFFLDLELAYQAAEKQLTISEGGKERLQYCYYEGPLTDITLKNLIQITQRDFVSFFSNNALPIPSKVIYKNGQAINLNHDSPDIIEEIINYRKNNCDTCPPHKDTYYIDQLEALNTAKQQNLIALTNSHCSSIQLCYYHGEAIDINLDNLVNVDLEDVIPFFSETTLRFPTELLLHESLESALKNNISSHFKTGIDSAEKNKKNALQKLISQARKLVPKFTDKQLKVFIPVNTQIDIQNRGKECSFEEIKKVLMDNNYQVLIEPEHSQYDDLNPIQSIKEYINFNPHFTLQINALQNSYQSEACINISLWTKLTAQLENYSSFKPRKNDFVFSTTQNIQNHLLRCHIESAIELPEKVIKNGTIDIVLLLLENYIQFNEDNNNEMFTHSLSDRLNITIKSDTQNFSQKCQHNLNSNLEILKKYHVEFYDKVMSLINKEKIDILCEGSSNNDLFNVLEVSFNKTRLFKLNHYTLKRVTDQISLRDEHSTASIVSFGSGYELLKLFQHTHQPIDGHTMEVPIYLIEDDIRYLIFNLIIHNFTQILSSKRIYLIIEKTLEDFENIIMDSENPIPGFTITTRTGTNINAIDNLSQTVFDARTNRGNNLKKKVEEYYSTISNKQWSDKFLAKNSASLRVFAITSRFTSFLKYCMRDLVEGFNQLGATTIIIVETDDHKRMSHDGIIEQIDNFKPDLILIIDHFRSEYPTIPENIPFVNWIQDMLPNIVKNEIPPSEKDYTFVFAKDWCHFTKNLPNYNNHPIHFLPLGFNENIYYPLEKNNISLDCDILFVTHLIDPRKTFEAIRHPEKINILYNEGEIELLEFIDKDTLFKIYKLIMCYMNALSLEGYQEFSVYDVNVQVETLNKILMSENIYLDNNKIELIICKFGTRLHFEYINKMKTWPISILLKTDIEIKIDVYGKYWHLYDEFSEVSRGVAKNGEHLNKLMNHSKICLNGSPGISLHMRALEIIASGVFMISRSIHGDSSPITDFFVENEEVVLYKDEKELVDKVTYYLKHDNKRKIIEKNAYKKIKKIFTYQSISKKIIKTIYKNMKNK